MHYIAPYNQVGPSRWCPVLPTGGEGLTSGRYWQAYHLPCFNHPPSQGEIIAAMKQTGCGGYCDHNMTSQDLEAKKTAFLHDMTVGAVGFGWFSILFFALVAILGFFIVLRIWLYITRRVAEVRHDVYTDGRYQVPVVRPFFRTLLVLAGVVWLFWYFGAFHHG